MGVKRVSCGCCSNGHVCFMHADIPRGIPVHPCDCVGVMKRYVMRMRGTENEIGHAEANDPTSAGEKIWERYQDARAKANPELEEILNRDVPWALVSVHTER